MPSTDGRASTHVPSLRDVFDRHLRTDTRLHFEASQTVYASGDEDDALYLIESGQVKLSLSSAAGKDCLLAVYTEGDVFGESCFNGTGRRSESAVAMQRTVVRRVARRELAVESASPAIALLRHLALRLAEREAAILDLVTMSSEQRLANVLLAMAEKTGSPDGPHLVLEHRISHEELSQIVGTTRPRITAFLARFGHLGLIERKGRTIRVHRARTRQFAGRD